MTAVMPEVDTALSQQVMEELAPPCDSKDCDNTATWSLKVTNTVCGCVTYFLVCDPCKDKVLDATKDTAKKYWSCIKCGVQWGPCTYGDDLELELEKL